MTTDYDENIYTTAINKNAPDYQKRLAIAERKAREIESSAAMTSHVAEERQADYKQGSTADDGGDEEDKYALLPQRLKVAASNRTHLLTKCHRTDTVVFADRTSRLYRAGRTSTPRLPVVLRLATRRSREPLSTLLSSPRSLRHLHTRRNRLPPRLKRTRCLLYHLKLPMPSQQHKSRVSLREH